MLSADNQTSNIKQPLICIARSGRIIAQSLQRAGEHVIVLDRFNDLDTHSSSIHCEQLTDVSMAHVISKLESIRATVDFTHKPAVIYGSGVDTNPQLLSYLEDNVRVLGNSSDAVNFVRNPRCFFKLLYDLQINYPRVAFKQPAHLTDWLVKFHHLEGGAGIFSATDVAQQQQTEWPFYYQQRLNGTAFSVLFLANTQDIRIVGLHRHFSCQDSHSRPYVMQGLISGFKLSNEQFIQLREWIKQLVSVTGLMGLNSLDCLIADQQIVVLEVNPRPGSSISLYDNCYQNGLIKQHIRCFTGEQWDQPHQQTKINGFRIYYAEREITITEQISWPHWVADRPQPGTNFMPGDPICSVSATGDFEYSVLNVLQDRSRVIGQRLSGLRPDEID